MENWPGCDFLICFFSGGFPLDKAIQYVKLRRPFVVNSVVMQSLLWDRRVVLAILDAMGVPTPPRLVISRDGGPKVDPEAAAAFEQCTGMDMNRVLAKYARNTEHIVFKDDGIEVDGKFMAKPFIEKPVDGENHNINIYYSKDKGGGGRRLFRKVPENFSLFFLKKKPKADLCVCRSVTNRASTIQTCTHRTKRVHGCTSNSWKAKTAKTSSSTLSDLHSFMQKPESKIPISFALCNQATPSPLSFFCSKDGIFVAFPAVIVPAWTNLFLGHRLWTVS